ncbi:MAG: hypothetical protein LQ350_006541 [Teloschistes chrysophthalmus]|nr:MAG: hypothetical protein LQ350_006541 [Niorma chrysophthalma]
MADLPTSHQDLDSAESHSAEHGSIASRVASRRRVLRELKLAQDLAVVDRLRIDLQQTLQYYTQEELDDLDADLLLFNMTPEAREWTEKVKKYCAEERGTILDPNPKVAGRPIDLHNLYNHVLGLGGYDAVSAKKKGWREVAAMFGIANANAAAYAHALKTLYYKNLAAYEIKTHHNKQPPPKQILEDLTAKGGDLLNRTLHNFRSTVEDAEASGEEEAAATPSADRMDVDDPASAAGRSTRGLRQAPPQRVLFQPDLTPSRQTRTGIVHGQSPQPTTSVSAGYPTLAATHQQSVPHGIVNYEPRPPMPLTLRGVTTPANNSVRFNQEKSVAYGGHAKDMTKPGCGYNGPNIYVRTLQALRSGLEAEQWYSVHHLAKISHERGDKFKFEAFPNLAEAMIEFIISITSVYYDIEWEFDYQEVKQGIHILDCINGTPDIPQRLQSLPRIDYQDDLEPEDLAMRFQKVTETGLALRNLSFMEENAFYLSDMKEMRDMLSIILSLPADPRLIELKIDLMETAEMVVRWWVMPTTDPVYQIFLNILDVSTDRGMILPTLRAVCRISMNLEYNNFFGGAWLSLLQRLSDYLLLQDEELVGAILDFYYQYTANPVNVAMLLFNADSIEHSLPRLIKLLSRLLRYGEGETYTRTILQFGVSEIPADTIANVPADLLQQLLQMDEPERSNTWLKCVFEEHKDSEITQIALWQAYRSRFEQHSLGAVPNHNAPGLLPAAEFIKNVSIIFENATAQVISGPSSKFIIKGIRPRRIPIDLRQHMYFKCWWQGPTQTTPCGDFHPSPDILFEHIITAHCGAVRLPPEPGKPRGKWDHSDADTLVPGLDCYWAGTCHRFTTNNNPVLDKTKKRLILHLKQHMPETGSKAAHQRKYNRTPATATPIFHPNKLGPHGVHDPRILAAADGVTRLHRGEIDEEGRKEVAHYLVHHNTPADEKGDPCGLSLSAALILRNLVRNVPRASDLLRQPDREFEMLGLGPGRKNVHEWDSTGHMANWGYFTSNRFKRKEVWTEELFGRGALWEDLVWTLTFNRTLGPMVSDIMLLVNKGMQEVGDPFAVPYA